MQNSLYGGWTTFESSVLYWWFGKYLGHVITVILEDNDDVIRQRLDTCMWKYDHKHIWILF